MAIPKFSPKDPEETILVTFDFSNLLADASENILNSVWHVETFTGIDITPMSMLSGVSSFNQYSTSHLITGGVLGNVYHIHAVVTTNKSQVLKLSGSMEIISYN